MEMDEEDFKAKIIKYSIIGFVVLIVLLIIMAIITSGSSKKTIKNLEKSITLTSGEKYSLSYKDYTWTSSDKSVAIVNNSDEIEALKDGSTKITITTDSEVANFDVIVKKIDDAVILTNIKMEKNTIELEVNESYTMKVNVVPSNASSTEFSWFSSNEDIVTVENGTIKAISSGSAMVTVKSSNGYTDTCLVKVKGTGNEELPTGDLETISFDTTSLVLKKDIVYTINFETTPKDVIGNITWESSDTEVITVENGVIKTVGVGTATITAKSGDIAEEMYITVVQGDSNTPDVIDDGKEVKATAITLNQQEIVLKEGDSYTLVATISPDNTTNKNVSFTSSNAEIAKVDETGKVEAIKEGEVTITAKTANDLTTTCKVTVKKVETTPDPEPDPTPDPEPEPDIVEHFISLNINNVSLNIGDSIQLVETITPVNDVSSVYWYSSNPDVVEVNKGKITAKQSGTANITAELPNGNSASCFVSVSGNGSVVNVLAISLNAREVKLKVKGAFNFTATVIPSNATNKNITWKSSNTNVVTIDKNGKAVAKQNGAAIITAKSSNGIVATATVFVEGSSTRKATTTLTNSILGATYSESLGGTTFTKTISYNNRTYKLFKQRFFRDYSFWNGGNLADNGCGPVALASILSGYFYNVTPVEVGSIMEYGSFSRLASTAETYGFDNEGVTYYNSDDNNENLVSLLASKIRAHLNKGYPMIALVTKSTKCSPSNKYSGSDHFIAILGEKSNGNLIVLNPGIMDGEGTVEDLLRCYMQGDKKGFLLLTPSSDR